MERLSLAGSPQKGKSPRQKQNKKQQKQQNKKSHFYSEFGIVGGEVSFTSIRNESLSLVARLYLIFFLIFRLKAMMSGCSRGQQGLVMSRNKFQS